MESKAGPSPEKPSDRVVTRAEERLRIAKRVVETGTVVLHKTVEEHGVPADVALELEELAVERVPVGREVEHPQPIREEGDVLVVPVHEEVLVVTKKLWLKEELRVTRRKLQTSQHLEERVRTERIEIERRPPPAEKKEEER